MYDIVLLFMALFCFVAELYSSMVCDSVFCPVPWLSIELAVRDLTLSA